MVLAQVEHPYCLDQVSLSDPKQNWPKGEDFAYSTQTHALA